MAADIQREEARGAKGCDEGQPRLHENLSGASRRAPRREDGLVAPAGPLDVGHEALGAPCAQAAQPAVRGGFRGDMQEQQAKVAAMTDICRKYAAVYIDQADVEHGMPPRRRKRVGRTCRHGPTPSRPLVMDLVVGSDEPRVPEHPQVLVEHCDGRSTVEGIRCHGSTSGHAGDPPKERAAEVALVQRFHPKGGHVGTSRAQTRGRRDKRRVEASKRSDLSGRAQCKRAADVSKVNADRRDAGGGENDRGSSPEESAAVGSKGCLRPVHFDCFIDSMPRGSGRWAAHVRRRGRPQPRAQAARRQLSARHGRIANLAAR